MQIAWLAASVVVIGAACWGVGRLAGLVIRRQSPYWRALLPWLAGQGFVAVGLLAAPTPPLGGLATGAAVAGLVTLAAAALAARAPYPRGRALLIAWAIPWAAVMVISRF